MKKYISDILTKTDIDNWKAGHNYLIKAGTGFGKTTFVKDVLYNYCKDNNKSLVILSNRIVLRKQIINDTENKIHVISYQALEKCNRNGTEFNTLAYGFNSLDDFDFICFDECHYFFSDIMFNSYSDDVLKQSLKNNHSIKIFTSATPQILECYFLKEKNAELETVCNIKADYSYIKNIYSYTNKNVVDEILAGIPKDEKVLFFSSSKSRLEQLSNSYLDCKYFNADNKSDESNIDLYNSIINNSKFDCHILFTTKILDNGINIIDKDEKHIFIEMVDIIDFIQCLGRKRNIDELDNINLYFYIQPTNWLSTIIKKEKYELDLASYAIKDREGYRNSRSKAKIRPDLITNNGYVIKAVKYKYQFDIFNFKPIIDGESTYTDLVAKYIGINANDIINVEKSKDKDTLQIRLESFVGNKMYKDQQKEFIKFINENLIRPVNFNHGSIGINTINARLNELEIPYTIISAKNNTRDENRNKRYWYVEKISQQK